MKMRTKSGAASFYVVAFSTLILVIIAASFATAIIAEMARTSNDDLSQSAYDAALAGVEDAKLAYMNYQNCKNSGAKKGNSKPSEGPITCEDIIWWMENPDCDMVAHILGRIGKDEGGEVLVEKTMSTGSDGDSDQMNQAYTCVVIKTDLTDNVGTLSSTDSYRVIRVKLAEGSDANDIGAAKISWYLSDNGEEENETSLSYNNFLNDKVVFKPISENGASVPPTLAVQLVQTTSNFTLAQLNGKTTDNKTDRATVYLVPLGKDTNTSNSGNDNYIDVYNNGENVIGKEQVANTNSQTKNLPFVVHCDDEERRYVCTAIMELPEPIGGARVEDTFTFVVSVPYGQPETDISLELICNGGTDCGKYNNDGEIRPTDEDGRRTAIQSGAQISIDSTGRANDLYRRVEVRLDNAAAGSSAAFPFYAVEVLEDDPQNAALEKDLSVTSEWGSY